MDPAQMEDPLCKIILTKKIKAIKYIFAGRYLSITNGEVWNREGWGVSLVHR